jgi:hypothetical protein
MRQGDATQVLLAGAFRLLAHSDGLGEGTQATGTIDLRERG